MASTVRSGEFIDTLQQEKWDYYNKLVDTVKSLPCETDIHLEKPSSSHASLAFIVEETFQMYKDMGIPDAWKTILDGTIEQITNCLVDYPDSKKACSHATYKLASLVSQLFDARVAGIKMESAKYSADYIEFVTDLHVIYKRLTEDKEERRDSGTLVHFSGVPGPLVPRWHTERFHPDRVKDMYEDAT